MNFTESALQVLGHGGPVGKTSNVQLMLDDFLGSSQTHLADMGTIQAITNQRRVDLATARGQIGASPTGFSLRGMTTDLSDSVDDILRSVRKFDGDTVLHQAEELWGSARVRFDDMIHATGQSPRALMGMGMIAAGALAAVSLASGISGGGRSMAPLIQPDESKIQGSPAPFLGGNPNQQRSAMLQQGQQEGYEIQVSGKTRDRQPLGGVMSNSLSQSGVHGGNIHITEQDDTTSLTKEWVQGMVAGLLR